jgi:hypothetical protein
MRFVLTLCALWALLPAAVFAQVNLPTLPNRTVANCDGATQNSDQVRADSLPVVLVISAYDCSSCQSAASGWNTFANDNVGRIRVWSAKTFLYSSNTPTCTNYYSWEQSFNWANIHSFTDTAKYWFNLYQTQGTPRYVVFRAADGKPMYAGNNAALARSTATSLISSVTSTEPEAARPVVYPNPAQAGTHLTLPTHWTGADARLVDIQSRVVWQAVLSTPELTLPTSLVTGIYQLTTPRGSVRLRVQGN